VEGVIASDTDPLSQYFLLAGRSGGQVAIGGTASGDTFVLKGSSHADGGSIQLNTTVDIKSSSSFKNAVQVAPNFTGTGDSPICHVSDPKFSPPSATTYSQARGTFYRVQTGNTGGSITELDTVDVAAPVFGSIKPTTQVGVNINNQGAAGVTNSTGIYILAQSGSTNNYTFGFGASDTTAAGAYYGRIPVLYNGLLKYIHVFSA